MSDLLECELCKLLGPADQEDFSFMPPVYLFQHSEIHRKQTGQVGHEASVEISKACFPTVKRTRAIPRTPDDALELVVSPQNPRRYKNPMVQYCRAFLSNPGKETTNKCSICNTEFKLISSHRNSSSPPSHTRVITVLNHAFEHLGETLFECKDCDRKFITPERHRLHAAKKHGEQFSMKDHDARIYPYADRVCSLVYRCFTIYGKTCPKMWEKEPQRNKI